MTDQPTDSDVRCDALLEVAQHLASLSASTIRLHAGEMTAAEMRSVRAVLHWQARELMQRASTPIDVLPRNNTSPSPWALRYAMRIVDILCGSTAATAESSRPFIERVANLLDAVKKTDVESLTNDH